MTEKIKRVSFDDSSKLRGFSEIFPKGNRVEQTGSLRNLKQSSLNSNTYIGREKRFIECRQFSLLFFWV